MIVNNNTYIYKHLGYINLPSVIKEYNANSDIKDFKLDLYKLAYDVANNNADMITCDDNNDVVELSVKEINKYIIDGILSYDNSYYFEYDIDADDFLDYDVDDVDEPCNSFIDIYSLKRIEENITKAFLQNLLKEYGSITLVFINKDLDKTTKFVCSSIEESLRITDLHKKSNVKYEISIEVTKTIKFE